MARPRPNLSLGRHAVAAALWAFLLPVWAETPQALLDRAQAETRVDPEAVRRHAEQALTLLAVEPDPDQQIRAHALLCSYYSESDRVQAQRHVDAGRSLVPRARRPALRALIANCEGELYEYANENARAAAFYQEAVTVAEQYGERELLADSLFLRGYLSGVQGGFSAGLDDLQRAQEIYEELGLQQQVRNTVNGIASLYSRVGDYQQARDYYEASLKLQQQAGLTRDLVVTRYNLGRVLERLKDWNGAEQAFNEVLRLSRQISYVRGEAYALRGLAQVQNARGNHIDALALTDRAVQQQGATTDEMLRAQILLQRGIALLGLQRPRESIDVLRTALELFTKAESILDIGSARAELARALAAVGDWQGAYEQHVQYQTAQDALQQRQLDQRYASLTAAKDRQNALLQQQKDATVHALNQEKRASRLQEALILMIIVLAAVLATLAWRGRTTSRAMRALAMTDELTGVPNRRQVLGQLEQLLRVGRGCSVLIVDIDHFKSINDEYGHLVGDDILRAVSAALRSVAQEPVKLGRLGGEEFLIVSPDAPEIAARRLAERLLAQVRTLDLGRDLPGRRLTVSVGLTVTVAGDTITHLLRRADEALYAAKASGRDCVVARLAGGTPTPSRFSAA
ncbi:MAG TPA: tetratricopeptide repeat-containing diguanylate cyclase [Burkholderiaceae bacterium]|nr:tetratricopeptide repeat-containing diguanylate cyclase [Burkholderiaceae bacterium]